MKQNDPEVIQQLREFFAHQPELYFWIIQYGATHQLLSCEIRCRGMPDRIKLLCRGCYYICGNPLGGPYSLEITKGSEDNNDQESYQITGNNGQFVMKCSDIAIAHVEGDTFSRFLGKQTSE